MDAKLAETIGKPNSWVEIQVTAEKHLANVETWLKGQQNAAVRRELLKLKELYEIMIAVSQSMITRLTLQASVKALR